MDKFRYLSVGLGAFRRAARYCSTSVTEKLANVDHSSKVIMMYGGAMVAVQTIKYLIDYGGERAEDANFKELEKQIEEERTKCDDLKKKLTVMKLAEKSGMAKYKC